MWNVKVAGKNCLRQGFVAVEGSLLWRTKPLFSSCWAQVSTLLASMLGSARPKSRARQSSVVLVLGLNILIDSGLGPVVPHPKSIKAQITTAAKRYLARHANPRDGFADKFSVIF
jgi:hypothetical protein